MENILEILDKHLDEIAIFLLAIFLLIWVKMIISSVKMPPSYYSNKKIEDTIVKKILVTRLLDDSEKMEKIKTLYKD